MDRMSKRANRMMALLRGQMGAWLRTPRTTVLIVLLLIYSSGIAADYGEFFASQVDRVYFGETVFFYLSRGFTTSLTMMSAVVMMLLSEVPRRTALQNHLLIRSSRVRWLWSLIFFCALALALMLLLLLAVYMAFTLPHLSPGTGWSDVERFARTNDPYLVRLIPEVVTDSGLSPLSASLLAFGVMFLYYMMYLMLILLCSLLGAPNLGLMIYLSLFFLHVTVMWESVPGLYLPVSTSNIMIIMNSVRRERALAAVWRALAGMGGVVALLIGAMFPIVRRTELRFNGRN